MGKGGQTVSATEFAELTGVSRERLRTWERRFGFPRPTRVGQGPRRYPLADAPRVVAVRRAAEQGVPLEQAIADARAPTGDEVTVDALADIVLAAPAPVVLVVGPEPLRVAFTNAPERLDRRGIVVGQALDALPWFAGSDLERTLRTLFTGTTAALECTIPAVESGDPPRRTIAYRLPVRPGEPPAVALVGMERERERRVRRERDTLQRELDVVRERGDRQGDWLRLAATLAERFQHEADASVLGTSATTLLRGLGAVDVAIATYMTGELALARSSRGVLGPRMVTVTGYEDLAGLMHVGQPGWLARSSARAFGAPASLAMLAVPIQVVGETLGVLLVLFDEAPELDGDMRGLLTIVSAGLGFTLLRTRLVASRREQDAEAPPG